MADPSYACPACGHEGFPEPPWEDGVPSFDICSGCGIQFGYTDAAGGDEAKRREIWRTWVSSAGRRSDT